MAGSNKAAHLHLLEAVGQVNLRRSVDMFVEGFPFKTLFVLGPISSRLSPDGHLICSGHFFLSGGMPRGGDQQPGHE